MARRGAAACWLLITASIACSEHAGDDESARSATAAMDIPAGETAKAEPTCEQPLPVFEAGKQTTTVCPDAAEQRGLTIVDLSDDWVPRLFRAEDGGAGQDSIPYRDTYVALANNRLGKSHNWDRARQDVFLELYGIPPSFRLLVRRLSDHVRFACHAAIGATAFAAIKQPNMDVFLPPRSAAERAAVAALDARLVCEGLLPRQLPRRMTRRPRWRVQAALAAYQRKHAIVTRGLLDRETRRVLAEDPRELEFRALLRTLRARVVDATGVIEDGSARGERGQVLGRRIDGAAFYIGDYETLPDGAPDHTSVATEAAARALGWLDVDSAAVFLASRGPEGTGSLRVAIQLPPPPDYHSAHMELRAEIDRGDVWYEKPNRRGRVERRPTLTLWARRPDGTEIALVRWHTTIGGWKKEVGRWGNIVLAYKNSDVGARVWRDLVALPAWLPPPDTPPRTMVRSVGGGKWVADTDLIGPGYASAYGLVMLVHHQMVERKGKTLWWDNGIRTHGSVSYDSIIKGESHGCHRLFNQSAVQLASFLLDHRQHVRRGLDGRPFTRIFTWNGRTVRLPIPHRGYRFELTPPVQVDVLKGRIKGRMRRVPRQVVSVRR